MGKCHAACFGVLLTPSGQKWIIAALTSPRSTFKACDFASVYHCSPKTTRRTVRKTKQYTNIVQFKVFQVWIFLTEHKLNFFYADFYESATHTPSLLFTCRTTPQLQCHVMNKHVHFSVGLHSLFEKKNAWTLTNSCDLWLYVFSAGEASWLAEAEAQGDQGEDSSDDVCSRYAMLLIVLVPFSTGCPSFPCLH